MSNKDVTPKVHLFDRLDKLHNDAVIMVMLPTGEKYQSTVMELKQFTNVDVLKEINQIKEDLKEMKVTKAAILKAFKKSSSVGFGKPLNILADIGVEKTKVKGNFYSDGKRVRVNLNGKWHTLKLDNDN